MTFPNVLVCCSWVQKMAGGSNADRLEVVGDEWSTRDEVLRVINDFILVSC